MKEVKKEDHPFIVKDVVQGDATLAESNLFNSISAKELQEAIDHIIHNPNITESKRLLLVKDLWRVNYSVKPPSVEEFLTQKYIGSVADNLYDHIKDWLSEYMNPTGKKRVLVLSTAIGLGKSTMAAILIVYINLLLNYMRDPKKFFNLNKMSPIVSVLLSFTLKKANQLLVQPFAGLLRASPIFHMVRQEQNLEKKQKDIPKGHISYTTAGRMGAFQFSKDLHITVVSERSSLLGLNIVAGVASEISFWIKRGIAVEEIWGTFQDLRNRINTRFRHTYPSTTILDSSPLDIDLSPIDKWIYTGEAEKDPEVMVVNKKTWDVFPESFPIWQKTLETFPVFRGNSYKPAKILSPTDSRDVYQDDEIYDVPIDAKLPFEQDLKKCIADYCAYPSGGLSKLIEGGRFIENIFTPILKNQYTMLDIPEEREPKGLIWDMIKSKFFIDLGDKYVIYRSPNAPRAIHIDLAEVKDIASVTMSHKEYNLEGEEIIIHDFNLPLGKGKSRINLDAICEFIIDLRNKGKVPIVKVTFDKYASPAFIQRLKREGFNAGLLSVDASTAPYFLYSTYLKNGRIKAGRSIHLKNNLKSLVITSTEKGKEKVDHVQGAPIYTDSGNWKTSQVGYRAKDVSDSSCGSAYTLITEIKEKPTYIFDDTVDPEDIEKMKKKVLDTVHTKFGLSIKKTSKAVEVSL